MTTTALAMDDLPASSSSTACDLPSDLPMVWITQGKTDHAAYILKIENDGRRLVKWVASELTQWVTADAVVKTELPKRRRRRQTQKNDFIFPGVHNKKAASNNNNRKPVAVATTVPTNDDPGKHNKKRPRKKEDTVPTVATARVEPPPPKKVTAEVKVVQQQQQQQPPKPKNKNDFGDKKYPIGTKVYKEFPPFGWFSGVVVGHTQRWWYQVQYEDDDSEEMTEKELDKIVVQETTTTATTENADQDDDETESEASFVAQQQTAGEATSSEAAATARPRRRSSTLRPKVTILPRRGSSLSTTTSGTRLLSEEIKGGTMSTSEESDEEMETPIALMAQQKKKRSAEEEEATAAPAPAPRTSKRFRREQVAKDDDDDDDTETEHEADPILHDKEPEDVPQPKLQPDETSQPALKSSPVTSQPTQGHKESAPERNEVEETKAKEEKAQPVDQADEVARETPPAIGKEDSVEASLELKKQLEQEQSDDPPQATQEDATTIMPEDLKSEDGKGAIEEEEANKAVDEARVEALAEATQPTVIAESKDDMETTEEIEGKRRESDEKPAEKNYNNKDEEKDHPVENQEELTVSATPASDNCNDGKEPPNSEEGQGAKPISNTTNQPPTDNASALLEPKANNLQEEPKTKIRQEPKEENEPLEAGEHKDKEGISKVANASSTNSLTKRIFENNGKQQSGQTTDDKAVSVETVTKEGSSNAIKNIDTTTQVPPKLDTVDNKESTTVASDAPVVGSEREKEAAAHAVPSSKPSSPDSEDGKMETKLDSAVETAEPPIKAATVEKVAPVDKVAPVEGNEPESAPKKATPPVASAKAVPNSAAPKETSVSSSDKSQKSPDPVEASTATPKTSSVSSSSDKSQESPEKPTETQLLKDKATKLAPGSNPDLAKEKANSTAVSSTKSTAPASPTETDSQERSAKPGYSASAGDTPELSTPFEPDSNTAKSNTPAAFPVRGSSPSMPAGTDSKEDTKPVSASTAKSKDETKPDSALVAAPANPSLTQAPEAIAPIASSSRPSADSKEQATKPVASSTGIDAVQSSPPAKEQTNKIIVAPGKPKKDSEKGATKGNELSGCATSLSKTQETKPSAAATPTTKPGATTAGENLDASMGAKLPKKPESTPAAAGAEQSAKPNLAATNSAVAVATDETVLSGPAQTTEVDVKKQATKSSSSRAGNNASKSNGSAQTPPSKQGTSNSGEASAPPKPAGKDAEGKPKEAAGQAEAKRSSKPFGEDKARSNESKEEVIPPVTTSGGGPGNDLPKNNGEKPSGGKPKPSKSDPSEQDSIPLAVAASGGSNGASNPPASPKEQTAKPAAENGAGAAKPPMASVGNSDAANKQHSTQPTGAVPAAAPVASNVPMAKHAAPPKKRPPPPPADQAVRKSRRIALKKDKQDKEEEKQAKRPSKKKKKTETDEVFQKNGGKDKEASKEKDEDSRKETIEENKHDKAEEASGSSDEEMGSSASTASQSHSSQGGAVKKSCEVDGEESDDKVLPEDIEMICSDNEEDDEANKDEEEAAKEPALDRMDLAAALLSMHAILPAPGKPAADELATAQDAAMCVKVTQPPKTGYQYHPPETCCPVCGQHIEALGAAPVDWERPLYPTRNKAEIEAIVEHTTHYHSDMPLWNVLEATHKLEFEEGTEVAVTPVAYVKLALRHAVCSSYSIDEDLLDMTKLRDMFVRRLGIARGFIRWSPDSFLEGRKFVNCGGQTVTSADLRRSSLLLLAYLEEHVLENAFQKKFDLTRELAHSMPFLKWRNAVQCVFLDPNGVENSWFMRDDQPDQPDEYMYDNEEEEDGAQQHAQQQEEETAAAAAPPPPVL